MAADHLTGARPLRVLALVEAASVTGPAKNLLEYAVRARESAGVEISVAAFLRGGAENLFTAAAQAAAVTVYRIGERRRFDRSVIGQIEQAVACCRPDIVQTHNFKAHFLARWMGLHRRHRWLAFHHGYTWPMLHVRLYNQLDRWSLRAAHQVVTVCEAFARDLERRGIAPEKIAVLHNSAPPFAGATAAEIDAVRRRLAIPPGATVAISVGRLSREKGHADLLDVLTRLPHSELLQLRLILVGDGPERERLVQQIARLGLGATVSLGGFQSDVRPYYSLADLMVLPSHTEGSPNALLEAMAAGLPVVACAVGGVPDIARHEETALLVGRGDTAAMAAAIGRLLADPGLRLRLGQRAQLAARNFTPDVYCRTLTQLYHGLMCCDSGNSTGVAEAV